jgi:hypothetical protein
MTPGVLTEPDTLVTADVLLSTVLALPTVGGKGFALESPPPPPQDVRNGVIAAVSKITSEVLTVRMRSNFIVESSSVKYMEGLNNPTRATARAAM